METKKSFNWDDLVFELKNKDYGAFFLRTVYRKNITIATGISLLILLFLVGPPFIMAKLNKNEKKLIYNTFTAELTDIRNHDVTPPPPPPPPPPMAEIKEQAKFILKIVDSTSDVVDIMPNDMRNDSLGNNKLLVDVDPPKLPPTDIDPTPKTYISVQEMPEFPGGDQAVLDYIYLNFKYPKNTIDNNITGKVYVEFVVNEFGKVVEVRVLRGLDESSTKEAIRVVSSLPEWKPGKQDGNPVRVKFVVPIVLSLE